MKPAFDGETCTLSITDATPGDGGEYQCAARNELGTAFCSAKLRVMKASGKPEFKEPMEDVEVFVGEEAVFEVLPAGSPEPDVEWFKGEEKVRSGGRVTVDVDDEDGVVSLIVKKCQPSDAGSYTCKLSNASGSVTCAAELVIKEHQSAPRFDEGTSEETVEVWEGAPLCLVTTVSGTPTPTVEWFKENRPAKRIKRAELTTKGAKNTLKVAKATPDDSGVYRCQASSPGGAVAKVFNVIVHGTNKGLLLHSITLSTLSLPRLINIQFPQKPRQKCYITHYEELGFS